LPYGQEQWQVASPFWDAPDRNDHASALWVDEKGTLFHFNGLSAAGTWGSLATIMRTSTDNGATWSKARLIMPEHGLHHMPVESVIRTREGAILVPCDAVPGGSGGTAVLVSRDDGKTWIDPADGKPVPSFAAGSKGATIAGIHAGFVQLKDGALMAFGRGNAIDGRMPRSVSTDLGKSWTYSASPFPGIGGGQRLAILRLAEGPILFCSFGRKMTITDAAGKQRAVSGLFAALSTDEGKTWSVKRLISDDGPPRTIDGGGNTGRFTMSATSAEPKGYMSICQTPDRLIHLISSKQHYVFNLAWINTPAPDRQDARPTPAPDRQDARPTAKPPGVVIDTSPDFGRVYVGSPSLAVLPNGDYVASHDWFGPGTKYNRTAVLGSSDRGKTWKHLTDIQGQWWSNLFVHNKALYIMGVNRRYGQVVIRRSTDGGKTWTEPKDGNTGLLTDDDNCHCAPVPVVFHNGRIWRAMEDRNPPSGWGTTFRSFVLSAPVDADPLKRDNWTFSNRLRTKPEWLGGGWLEGNVVVTPDGKLVNLLRVALKGGDKAAIVRVSDDGTTVTFDPEKDFIDFPGGSNKFTIRYDEKTKRYWSLVNKEKDPVAYRNILTLTSSADLRTWKVESIILRHHDSKHHAWQYPDWLFEGDDLIAVSRTAWDGSHNAHDANYMTFHRIANFRKLTPADSPPYVGR